ncbi:hypothetical protein LR948_14540 [Roseivivax sp. GX 12232]|uniref:hypothetical protein n=1 Tax=Roseivivax sp. GX 12232 TaxID=2900547 RepID=UPI001E3F7717|nr:hypothetical protein [Roseivivax sp. GX 12232]MCE0506585.1 hypothetical protein [Roseivivax sp. GX 12232]
MNSVFSLTLRLPQIDLMSILPDIALGYLYALIPLLWISRSDRPSKSIYIFLYFSNLIPISFFLVADHEMSILVRHFRALFCVLCFFIIYFAYLVPTTSIKPLRYQSQIGWGIIWVLVIFGPTYLVLTNPTAFANVSFFDVYEKRLELRDAVNDGSFSRINVYATNWMGVALAPFLAVYGFQTRRPVYIGMAVMIAFVAFAVSTHKTVFFTTIIVLLFAASTRYAQRLRLSIDGIALNLAFVIVIGFITIPYFVDILLGAGPVTSWLTHFRIFQNNGYLTSVYMEFFGAQPILLYADSFLSGIIQSDFDLSYSRRVGDYITQYEARNNANANFLADGYVNLGYLGMIFSSLQMALVLWLIDSLARGRDMTLVAFTVLPAGLVFSNVPVHTGLISNGIAISMMLITLLPKKTPTPRLSQNPLPGAPYTA